MMKPWLLRAMLPLAMLGIVVLFTRPVAGAIGIVVSVLLLRLLNGPFELPATDEVPPPYFRDPRHS